MPLIETVVPLQLTANGNPWVARSARVRTVRSQKLVRNVEMSRKLISSGSPFEKQVGYSRAVVQNDWLFLAGTTGGDPLTGTMPDCEIEQTRNIFRKIEAAMEQADFALSDVVRVTYYITDQAYFLRIAPVLQQNFGLILPAATCVVVAGLVSDDMKVEIEVTALKDRS